MKSIFAEALYTGTKYLKGKWINFKDQKIHSITSSERQIGEKVGAFDYVTPAFIDAHSHIGMERYGEGSEYDLNEGLNTILPLADALDSVHMEDLYFRDSVAAGVLYSCVMPGSYNLISGKTAILRNWAPTTLSALMGRAGTKAALGRNTTIEDEDAERPVTRMGGLNILRAAFKESIDKKKDKESFRYTWGELLALHDIQTGKERLRVHVHHDDDIAALLRLADEFNLNFTIEHALGAHTRSSEVYRELAKRNISVVYGPLDCYRSSIELRWPTHENIATLLGSGIRFGLMSDHPEILQSTLRFSLRHFLAVGMSPADCIGLITIRNAEILGIDDQVGELKRGRMASLVGWSGDPFHMASRPRQVWAEGQLVHAHPLFGQQAVEL